MQLKQTQQIMNPNWQEANQLAVYKWSQGVEPETNLEKSNCSWSEQDLNSERSNQNINTISFSVYNPFPFSFSFVRL